MNYRHIYMRIISHAKQKMNLGLRPKNQLDKKNFPNQYFEFHHILPKSIFPVWKDRKTNLVALTAREHFFCHQLLTKIYDQVELKRALYLMYYRLRKPINSREFEKLRIKNIKCLQLERSLQKGRCFFTNGKVEIMCKKRPNGFWKGRLGFPNRKDLRYADIVFLKHLCKFCKDPSLNELALLKHRKRIKSKIHDLRSKAGKISNNEANLKKKLETVKAKNLSMGKELLKEKYSNFKKMTLEKQLAYRQKQRENSTGKLWYNNGEKNVKSRFCPKGFIKGRLPMISKNRVSQKGENNNNAKVITEVCTNFQWKLQKEAIKDLGCGSYVFRLFRDSQNYTINVLNLLNYYNSKDLTIPKKLIDWCKNHPKIMHKGLLGNSATFKRA